MPLAAIGVGVAGAICGAHARTYRRLPGAGVDVGVDALVDAVARDQHTRRVVGVDDNRDEFERKRRVLRRHGYPPDKQEQATKTIIEQAEALSAVKS